MPKRHPSHFAKVLETLTILHPTNPHDPIDAQTLADFIDLTPEQVSPYLSILYYTGYLARVGTHKRFVLYIRTRKPLTTKSASIGRLYKTRLGRKSGKDYTPSPKQIAIEISQAVIMALRQKLGRRRP
jgi:hypothetical protein